MFLVFFPSLFLIRLHPVLWCILLRMGHLIFHVQLKCRYNNNILQSCGFNHVDDQVSTVLSDGSVVEGGTRTRRWTSMFIHLYIHFVIGLYSV